MWSRCSPAIILQFPVGRIHRHLQLAIRNDEVLNKLLSGVTTIGLGGVPPNTQAVQNAYLPLHVWHPHWLPLARVVSFQTSHLPTVLIPSTYDTCTDHHWPEPLILIPPPQYPDIQTQVFPSFSSLTRFSSWYKEAFQTIPAFRIEQVINSFTVRREAVYLGVSQLKQNRNLCNWLLSYTPLSLYLNLLAFSLKEK